jgi:hypothetical protein
MTDTLDTPDIVAVSSSSDSIDSPTTSNTNSHFHRPASYLEQEEGVLRDVLEELDRERHKRAELEAQVRVLQEELHSQRRKNSKSTKTSVRDYTQIVTERDGYKEILDALTEKRPAFATAALQEKKIGTSSPQQQQHRNHNSNSNSSTLPIHIIRLLEVMPWDSRAKQYIFGMEQLYEWQIYGVDKKWKGKELRQFPTFFKTLPIVIPTPGKTVTEVPRSNLPFGGIAPPKQCVLTNIEVNTILNIDQGYPLPEDGGGWTWVGPWRVEKNTHTDEQGWMYSNDVQVLPDPQTYNNEFRLPEKGQPNMMKRRRKWTRLRVLIDYPYASTMTREYLKLVAEKATLDVNVDKLSGQLVETKMVLTTMEGEHLAYQERTNARIKELERELADQNNTSLGLGAGIDKLTGVTDTTRMIGSETLESKKIDQVAEIRSAVTQWVSERVEKVQHKQQRHNSKGDASLEALTAELNSVIDGSPGDTGTAATSKIANKDVPGNTMDAKQQLFESLRDKSTGLFEVLKQKGGQELDKFKQGGGGLPWQRKVGGMHNRDNSQNTAGTASNNGGASSGIVHGKVAKLETLKSESSTASTSDDMPTSESLR